MCFVLVRRRSPPRRRRAFSFLGAFAEPSLRRRRLSLLRIGLALLVRYLLDMSRATERCQWRTQSSAGSAGGAVQRKRRLRWSSASISVSCDQWRGIRQPRSHVAASMPTRH